MPLSRLAEKSITESVDESVCFLISQKETNNSGETIEVLRRVSLDSLVKVLDAKSSAASRQNICVNGVPLYPVTFVDVDTDGNVSLRDDGRGEYLLGLSISGNVVLKNIRNAVDNKET